MTSSGFAVCCSARASSMSSEISVVISPDLLDDVREQPPSLPARECTVAREDLDVRPQARERRPELVGRVRHELPLRAGRLLERSEHRVERRGETAQLVAPADVDPLGQVSGLGDALGGLGEPTNGSERRPRHHEAESRGERRSRPPAMRSRRSPRCLSVSSTSVSGRATCTAYPGEYGNVSTRRCVPSTSMSSLKELGRFPRATASSASPTGSGVLSPGGRIVLPFDFTTWT